MISAELLAFEEEEPVLEDEEEKAKGAAGAGAGTAAGAAGDKKPLVKPK